MYEGAVWPCTGEAGGGPDENVDSPNPDPKPSISSSDERLLENRRIAKRIAMKNHYPKSGSILNQEKNHYLQNSQYFYPNSNYL